MPVNDAALAAGAAGAILLWSALENRKALNVIQDLIAGKKPAPGPVGTAGGGTGGGGVTGPASDSAIASDALKYVGAGYVWGGAPAGGIGNWDCSSFCNWVCGHDLQLPIPGYASGQYNGSVHGPPTGSWLLWNGLTTIGHDGAQSEAGDLCVWQTHMGIAIGGGQMVSAENPTDGTQRGTIGSGITGFIPGELLFIRRYA